MQGAQWKQALALIGLIFLCRVDYVASSLMMPFAFGNRKDAIDCLMIVESVWFGPERSVFVISFWIPHGVLFYALDSLRCSESNGWRWFRFYSREACKSLLDTNKTPILFFRRLQLQRLVGRYEWACVGLHDIPQGLSQVVAGHGPPAFSCPL